MGIVKIKCPKTGNPVDTGVGMDVSSFESATLENNTIGNCPERGGSHTWSKDDAFVEG